MLVAAKLKAKKYAVVRNFHFNKELKCTCFDNTPCYMCSSTRVCVRKCVFLFSGRRSILSEMEERIARAIKKQTWWQTNVKLYVNLLYNGQHNNSSACNAVTVVASIECYVQQCDLNY